VSSKPLFFILKFNYHKRIEHFIMGYDDGGSILTPIILGGILIGGYYVYTRYKKAKGGGGNDDTGGGGGCGNKSCPSGQQLNDNCNCVAGGSTGTAPSPGKVVYTSASWTASRNPASGPKNGKFGAQDPKDKNFMASHAGSGCSFKIGGGVLTLGGDRCRAYLIGNNYNSMMEFDGMFVDGKGDFSMRLRSRHNEGGSSSNRFGGYGLSIEPNGKGGFAREDYHNVHAWTTGDKWQIVSGAKGQWFRARFAVQDSGSSVTMSVWVMEGGRWVLKGRAADPKPNAWANKRTLFDKYSYSWIRTNGGGKIAVRNLRITEVGPLSGSSQFTQLVIQSYNARSNLSFPMQYPYRY
jgi:hypothetical protein